MVNRAAATIIDCVVDLQNYVNQQFMLNMHTAAYRFTATYIDCVVDLLNSN